MEHAYYLSIPEFYMLIEKSGSQVFFGFHDRSFKEPTQNELIYQMGKMIRKGLLINKGSFLKMEGGLQSIITTIVTAKRCLVIRYSNPTQKMICCYVGKSVAVVEQSTVSRVAGVRLHEISLDDFSYVCSQWLSDQRTGMVFEEDSEDDEAVEYLIESGFSMDSKDIVALDAAIWMVDCFNSRNGELETRSVLLDGVFKTQILTLSKDHAMLVPSSDAQIERQINSWIEGDSSYD